MAENESELLHASEESGMPDLSAAIGKLMAHPELLQMAASVLRDTSDTNADNAERPSEDRSDEAEADSADQTTGKRTGMDLSALMQLAGPLLSGGGRSKPPDVKDGGIIRCTALLVALKPYLSPHRCNTVDKIVALNRFSSLFEARK